MRATLIEDNDLVGSDSTQEDRSDRLIAIRVPRIDPVHDDLDQLRFAVDFQRLDSDRQLDESVTAPPFAFANQWIKKEAQPRSQRDQPHKTANRGGEDMRHEAATPFGVRLIVIEIRLSV
jgi:hypothetical protein